MPVVAVYMLVVTLIVEYVCMGNTINTRGARNDRSNSSYEGDGGPNQKTYFYHASAHMFACLYEENVRLIIDVSKLIFELQQKHLEITRHVLFFRLQALI